MSLICIYIYIYIYRERERERERERKLIPLAVELVELLGNICVCVERERESITPVTPTCS